jgi:UDP-glucuronate 4-epimerase
MRILLTGCAGFIGSHTLDRLLADGHHVIGVDNFDPFYARSLKLANLRPHVDQDLAAEGKGLSAKGIHSHSHLHSHSASKGSFELLEGDLADQTTYTKLKFLIGNEPLDAVIHLAAKAGVRPSIEDPVGYQRANVIATQNLLEFAKENDIKQFVFASSSSVYGVNPRVPWSESDAVLQPISPYASTKVSCELLGHVYSHLYGIRVLGLRFFTVYGPRQRPDLAINKFVRLIEAGEPIPVFGDGSTRRDYTYIDDIVNGIIGSLHYTGSNYEVINLGNDQTVTLSEMIATIETVVGKKAIIDRQSEQPGDVPQTWADVSKAKKLVGYAPSITFKEGVTSFYIWWRENQSFL